MENAIKAKCVNKLFNWIHMKYTNRERDNFINIASEFYGNSKP